MVDGLGTDVTLLALIGYKHQLSAMRLHNGWKFPQESALYKTSSALRLHLDWRSFRAS